MARAAQTLALLILRTALSGLVLGACEFALVAMHDRELFLSNSELLRFAGSALCSGASVVVLVSVTAALAFRLLRSLDEGGSAMLASVRAARLLGVLSWPLIAWIAWSLSAGRRVRDLPARWLVCLLLGACVAAGLSWLTRRLLQLGDRAPRELRIAMVVSLGGLALCAVGFDALALRRLYPAFHLALALCAWTSTAAAALLLPPARLSRVPALLSGAVALGLAFAAPLSLRGLAQAPNLRFAVEEAAPLTGFLLRGFSAPAAISGEHVVAHTAMPGAAPVSRVGIDLRGQDILLVTIDALRADRLRAYGGRGVTPELDALAERSVVFTHAYTPTPHTSYALGSLLTGKYLRPVLALPNAPSEHATLPRLLRRYGYRTAGLYPPAIFFVHQERFASLHADHFGFEYVKEMFAPARVRTEQVRRYLERAEPGHPVFVWVHLFEPHEPYEPPAERRHGDAPVDLYDGEVADVDAALGDLVRMFRAKRPRSTVIVTADHGEEFGEHGGFHHGTSLYEEQLRVPMLWSLPTQTTQRLVATPVELVDIAPTLLSALGVPRDARMRGDDLGALLVSDVNAPELRAFASIDDQRMLSDGRYKLLCDTRNAQCRLFDLQLDPGERHPSDQIDDPHASALREELSQLVASLPRMEAVAMEGGAAWPSVLARARLGDAAAGPELLPLLGSERSDVRAEALRSLTTLRVLQARHVVAGMVEHDSDALVRDEAAVCALALGEEAALGAAKDVLTRAVAQRGTADDLARRAALTLAHAGIAQSAPVLVALASDASAEEAARIEALELLAKLPASGLVAPLRALLADVRLRPAVVRALAALGGKAAADAIADAFTQERYPEARAAEARALLALRDARADMLIMRFVGTETGVPGAVALLLESGALAAPSQRGADLRSAQNVRAGSWQCAADGCVPGADAAVQLPARGAAAGEVRALLRVHASAEPAWLELAGTRKPLTEGFQEVAVDLAATRSPRVISVAASPGVQLFALLIAPRRADIPAPAPEPYDAGVDALEDDSPPGAAGPAPAIEPRR